MRLTGMTLRAAMLVVAMMSPALARALATETPRLRVTLLLPPTGLTSHGTRSNGPRVRRLRGPP